MTPQATKPIDHARQRVERELIRTRAEEHAFQRFHTRVDDMEISRCRAKSWVQRQNPFRRPSDENPAKTTTDQIEDAFRETLLETVHYEDEYDDSSIYESIGAELGPSIVHVLKYNDRISPELHVTVLDAAEQAYRDREALLKRLDREATSLADAHEQLSEINTTVSELAEPPFGSWCSEDLTSTHNHLTSLADDCELLAKQRQQIIDRRSPMDNLHLDAKDFNVYLYSSYGFTFPVLSGIATCVDRILRICEWIDQVLAERE